MLRILHLIQDMDGGGAQVQLALLAQYQVHSGHEVHVAILDRGLVFGRLGESGATIHEIACSGKYDPFVPIALMKLVTTLQPDIVHTWLTRMDVVGGAIAQVYGRPWVLSERASAPYYPRSLKNWVRSRVGKRASAIISNSAAGDSYWRTVGGAGGQRYIVPNGVPLDDIDRVSGRSSIPGAAGPVVLFAGRFAEQKNLLTLVAALRDVVDRSDAVAVLCGEGPLKPTIEAAIERHSLGDRVQVVGYQRDIWRLMKRAGVFVSVSLFEGHPNTVLEAMACRCPLVVSDIPEHREFLTESHAWIVNPHDSARIADAICQALTQAAEARRRVEAARAKVEEFSVSVAARRYEDVYRAVLARARDTSGGGH
jgi:glycosyltransferase involved in cell wall biosynthesis